MLAIYLLFWFLALFLVLPFGVKTDREMGVDPQPGHADSAPHSFAFGKIALRTTIVAAILFALFYANHHFGWIGIESFGGF